MGIGIRNPRNWDESSKNVFLGQVFCELTVSGSHVPLYETYTLDYYTPVLLLFKLDPFFFDADMAGMQREVTKIYDH